MTTRERAEAVREAAAEIDAAIREKGGETPGGLRNAAAAIAALPSGGEVVPLTVTSNGVYTAPEGEGYSPVSVNVPTGDSFERDDTWIFMDLTWEGSPLYVELSVYWVPGGATVDWGDGTVEPYTGPVVNYKCIKGHSYSQKGVYKIVLHGLRRGESSIDVAGRAKDYVQTMYVGKDSGSNFRLKHFYPTMFFRSENLNESSDASYRSPYNQIRLNTSKYLGNIYGVREFVVTTAGGLSTVNNIDDTAFAVFNANSEVYIGTANHLVYLELGENATLNWTPFSGCASTVRTVVLRGTDPKPNYFSSFGNAFSSDGYSIRVPSDVMTKYVLLNPYSTKADHIVPIGSAWDLALTGYGDAMAKFGADGNIVGGAAFDAPTVTTATQVKWTGLAKYFDATQKAAIEAAMSAKGYSVAW